MDKEYRDEMISHLNLLVQKNAIQGKHIYLFGHCHATEVLAELLLEYGCPAVAILDNSAAKQGRTFCNLPVRAPASILSEQPERSVVCVVARAYAAMLEQLRRIGYEGAIYQLVNYNSYAEHSLSDDTIGRMRVRMENGMALLEEMQKDFPGHFRVLCPFSALGDIYIMMSYLPYFLEKRSIQKCVIGVIGRACAQVAHLFGTYTVRVFSQGEMDKTVQAVLFTRDVGTFIAHQDRPYVVNLHGALYQKRISLEQMYCCGVFGLPWGTKPYKPLNWEQMHDWQDIPRGRAVILSPYAKSVAALPDTLWEQIVSGYSQKGFRCFTNVAGDERPLPQTEPVRVPINQMRSLVERAGIFVGIRSGICDVIKDADCRKIALYPDYNYCDTGWKAVDIYRLDGWENLEVNEDFQWNLS